MFPLILYELFLYILWQKNCIGIFSVDFLQITSRRVLVFNCHRVAISVNKNIILDFWMSVFIETRNLNSSTIGGSVTIFCINLGGGLQKRMYN
jgi:hypothetical protein